jgi:hypothetical protein
MSKNNELVVEEIPEDDDDDFSDTDYGFIIDANGELKTMMLPEELMNNPPSSIKKILKIFGIKDIHQFEPRTLH